MKALLADQSAAIQKLAKYKVGALFMEPGTGKTRAALELVNSVGECDFVLWLTPFQTKQNLRAELNKWGATGIRVEGIETLSNSDRVYIDLFNTLRNKAKAFIVVDESLKIKNWSAKRTQRIVELGKYAQYKLLLNGTPITRNIVDVWSQMEFLSPKILNMGSAEFKSTFCEWTKLTKRFGNKVLTREWITKYHNVDYLYALIEPYVYECDLKLNLGVQYITIDYELCDETKGAYNELKQVYLKVDELSWRSPNIFLELTQKMQHSYCASENKLQALGKLFSSIDPSKTLVYCKYVDSRKTVSQRFPKATVMSYGKHSFGLNLQHMNHIVFFDKTWDYAQRLQTERRIFRTGQTETCYYYDFTGNVGLEAMIDKNIAAKQSLLDYFKKTGVELIKKQL